jgi:hypothetical protein
MIPVWPLKIVQKLSFQLTIDVEGFLQFFNQTFLFLSHSQTPPTEKRSGHGKTSNNLLLLHTHSSTISQFHLSSTTAAVFILALHYRVFSKHATAPLSFFVFLICRKNFCVSFIITRYIYIWIWIDLLEFSAGYLMDLLDLGITSENHPTLVGQDTQHSTQVG